MNCTLLYLLLAAPPPLTLPPEIHGQAGTEILVSATTPGKIVNWVALDPGLDLVPSGKLTDPKSTYVTAGKIGSYRLMAITALADEPSLPATTTIVIDPPPLPFPQALQAAYDAETDPAKADAVKVLAGVNRGGALRKVRDPSLKTTDDLSAALGNVTSTLLDDTAIPKVRAVVNAYLDRQLPPAPLDANLRTRASGVLAAVADALAALGPTPPPIPPGPVDPFTQAVSTAYAAETDPARATQAAALAGIYQQGALTLVNETSLNTLGDLYTVMQAAAAKVVPATALPKVRAVVAAYLVAQLGTTPTTPLDAALRTKAGTAFTTVAAALGGLK